MSDISVYTWGAVTVSIAANIYFIVPTKSKRIATYQPNTLTVANWQDLATGASGDLYIEKGFLTILQEQYTLFCQKQADYGRNNVAVGGEQGLTIRLGDKVSRLFNLLGIGYGSNGSKSPSVNEPVSETFIDVANYGTIGVMVMRGLWPRCVQKTCGVSEKDRRDGP